MKTAGIAMLFGLCCMIGFRLGAKKTACLQTICSLRNDLQLFSERISSGVGTLHTIADEMNGALSEILKTYLEMLDTGQREEEATACALKGIRCCGTVPAGIRMFLTGLSAASRSDLILRAQALASVLERTETEAENEAKKARVLRISGVLTGAGLAILLL